MMMQFLPWHHLMLSGSSFATRLILHLVQGPPANANASHAAIRHHTTKVIKNLHSIAATRLRIYRQKPERTDFIHKKNDGEGTPLYHAVASLSDDFSSPPGSAICFIIAIHFLCPMMVSAKNDLKRDT